jgi:ABC-type multidrug transport system fused ATPase/permease subunit
MIKDLNKAHKLLPNNLKIRFIFLIFFILIGNIFEIISVALLIPILNILVGSTENIKDFLIKNNLDILIDFISIKKILYIFLIIYLIKSAFRLFLIHYQSNFIFTLFMVLINKLYKNYIFKNYLFHIKNDTPKLIRNLMSEIHSCAIGYMGAITNIFLETLIIFSLVCFLFYYRPNEIFFFIFFVGFLSLLLIKFLNIKSKNLGDKRQKFALTNLKNIVSTLGGIKEIKVNTKEKEVIQKFKITSENLRINNYLFQVLQQAPKIILELIVIISIVALMIYFLNIKMPTDEIVVFFGLMIGVFSRLLPSVYKLSSNYVNLNYYKPALELIYNEINSIKKNQKLKTNLKNAFKFRKTIEIKNLTFFYKDQKNKILDNVNLTINKGETIGVYGESGSGKSTLIDIIIGLLDPQKGKVLVDNIDINKNKNGWFSKIGYVPQNVYLKDDTIKNNIYFYENKSDNNTKRLRESLSISQLRKLNMNRQVGERGIKISGGQKQRVGLARALYKESDILILDESTSALDKKNEENFLNDVFKLKSKKTLIIISHKKNIVKKCNRVITIKNKKIVETKLT